MKTCIEWLLRQPRPGELPPSGAAVAAPSPGPAGAGAGSEGTLAAVGMEMKEHDIDLPCVLAVELMPSEEDANKVRYSYPVTCLVVV